VLFVGDSYTEGAGAPDDRTLPEQFRQLTQETRPAEIINLGVSGTGLPEYLRIARDGVALLKPDAVFLVICHNDLPTLPELGKIEPAPEFTRLSPWVPRALAGLGRKWEGKALPSRYYSGPVPFLAPVPSPTNPLSRKRPISNVDPAILSAMKRGTCSPHVL